MFRIQLYSYKPGVQQRLVYHIAHYPKETHLSNRNGSTVFKFVHRPRKEGVPPKHLPPQNIATRIGSINRPMGLALPQNDHEKQCSAYPRFILPDNILLRRSFPTSNIVHLFLCLQRKNDPQFIIRYLNTTAPSSQQCPHPLIRARAKPQCKDGWKREKGR